MSRSRNHRLLNVGRHMAHDYGLQRTEGLLTAHGQHRHQQLYLFEDFIVLRILGKGGELRKASPHSSRLRVSRRKEVSGGFVGLPWITGEVIPYAIKIDALPARHQPFPVRPMKVEVQDTRALQYLDPWSDIRQSPSVWHFTITRPAKDS